VRKAIGLSRLQRPAQYSRQLWHTLIDRNRFWWCCDMPEFFEERQWWTPSDLAEVLGLTDRAVRYHCSNMFGRRSRYRLNPREAFRVWSFIRKFGLKSRNMPEPHALRWQEERAA
jgi:hypothetical protein